MKGFGERLGAWRRARQLTQAQLAEKLGVQTSAVGAYEIDRREPPLERLVAIANALNVSTDELLGRQFHATTDDLLIALLKDAGYTIAYDAEQMLLITPPIPVDVNGKRRDFNATDNFPANDLRSRVVALLKDAALPFAESYVKQFLAIVDFARVKAFGIELDNTADVAGADRAAPNPAADPNDDTSEPS